MRQYVRNGPLYTLVFFICLFSIVVFYLGLSQTEQAFASSKGPRSDLPPAIPVSKPLASARPAALSVLDAASPNGQAPGSQPQSVSAGAAAGEPASVEPAGTPYVTTAYYLNVREKASAKSVILRTVEKGTILTVLQKLENGWLQLENEGYVHGAYAEPVQPDNPAPQVKIKAAAVPETEVRANAFADRAADSRPDKPTSEVISDSGLTEEEISEIFEGTELLGHNLEEAVLKIEEEYGINAYFTIAVMKLESGNGKSRLARVKNNLFGLNATGGNNEQAYSFDTKADSVHRFGKLIAEKYVGKGLTTIEKVARKYCPANAKWPSLVKSIMKSDHQKV